MEQLLIILKNILAGTGLNDVNVTADEEHRRISIVIHDEYVQARLDIILGALDHLVNLIGKKMGLPPYIVDVNFYRKERERLIVELARAAAHKAMVTKTDVELPPMNAYERRLVHVEITTHPELKTESTGAGRDRHIVIKHLN